MSEILMGERFVDKVIVREIEKKLRDLNSCGFHPVSLLLGKHYESVLQTDANLHSYKMEHQSEEVPANGSRFNTHAADKKSIKDGIKNNWQAFVWAMKHFNPEKLDASFVKEIARRVEPSLFSEDNVSYRESAVRPSGATWTPPYPAKIPGELEGEAGKIGYLGNLKSLLMDDSTSGVLEAAAYAHLHLDRIHPFEDGNGRTARVVQNVILKKMRGLPPPIIYPGERFDYHQHLDRAINDWRCRTGNPAEKFDSRGEKMFYNYIAGKVSASLDMLLDRAGK